MRKKMNYMFVLTIAFLCFVTGCDKLSDTLSKAKDDDNKNHSENCIECGNWEMTASIATTQGLCTYGKDMSSVVTFTYNEEEDDNSIVTMTDSTARINITGKSVECNSGSCTATYSGSFSENGCTRNAVLDIISMGDYNKTIYGELTINGTCGADFCKAVYNVTACKEGSCNSNTNNGGSTIPGTWKKTWSQKRSGGSCLEELKLDNLTITQTGNQITITDQDGLQYIGSSSGDAYLLMGSVKTTTGCTQTTDFNVKLNGSILTGRAGIKTVCGSDQTCRTDWDMSWQKEQ